jgi:voltage-gated potassium channel
MISFFIAFSRFFSSIYYGLKDQEFRVIFVLVIFLLTTGMFFYHGVEGWSWLDSLYFSVITLTTVGYGDITPHSTFGKIFTMIYIFVGLGIILSFITAIEHHARKENRKGEKENTA